MKKSINLEQELYGQWHGYELIDPEIENRILQARKSSSWKPKGKSKYHQTIEDDLKDELWEISKQALGKFPEVTKFKAIELYHLEENLDQVSRNTDYYMCIGQKLGPEEQEYFDSGKYQEYFDAEKDYYTICEQCMEHQRFWYYFNKWKETGRLSTPIEIDMLFKPGLSEVFSDDNIDDLELALFKE